MKDVDMTSFFSGMDKATEAMEEEFAKGAIRAGMQWLDDAVNETPTIPLREGTLRASGSVHVHGKYQGTLGEGGTPNTGTVDKKVLLTVGLNTPYAARQHEGVEFNFTEPGSGAKFLEIKKERHWKEYVEIMVRSVARRFGR